MTGPIQDANDPRVAAIVRQARLHFVSEGYAATRMEPIAREAGVSTATLYAFFESKSALFDAVIENAAVDFSARMAKVRAIGGHARERLVSFIHTYAEFMSDPFVRSVFRLVMAERPRFEDVAVRFFERGRTDFGAVLMAALVEMQEAGELKIEKPSWAAGQLMGMIEHPVFFVPLVTGDTVKSVRTTRQIAEDAVETFLARYGA